MFDSFTKHWRNHLENNVITKTEFTAATFPQHYRTVAEFSEPFNGDNCLADRLGIKLNACFTKLTKCPYRLHYEKNKSTVTPASFASEFVPTTRSWSETVFRSALRGRSNAEVTEIVESFYQNYETEVANDPDSYSMDYVHIVMDIERV